MISLCVCVCVHVCENKSIYFDAQSQHLVTVGISMFVITYFTGC